MQKFAVIVAGGSGKRMGAELPKQFIALQGLPILMHTLKAFHFDDIKILLVLPDHQTDHWNQLVATHRFDVPHQLVKGGKERFHSVQNGLNTIAESDGLVAIHDGVRPLVDRNIIRKSLNKIVPTDLSNHAQFAGNCKNFFMFNDNPRLATGSVNASDRSGVYPGTARTGVLTGITGSAQSKDAPGWFENS